MQQQQQQLTHAPTTAAAVKGGKSMGIFFRFPNITQLATGSVLAYTNTQLLFVVIIVYTIRFTFQFFEIILIAYFDILSRCLYDLCACRLPHVATICCSLRYISISVILLWLFLRFQLWLSFCSGKLYLFDIFVYILKIFIKWLLRINVLIVASGVMTSCVVRWVQFLKKSLHVKFDALFPVQLCNRKLLLSRTTFLLSNLAGALSLS